ncbi:hypothetical protein ACSQ67_009335 [Phaseolus vulgaris]
MFRTLILFFLFSVTPTLVLPTNSHVNFNTSSMLLAQNHSKTLNKVGDDVFMACDDRKNCSSNNSVDNHSAHVARRLDSVTNFTSNPNMTLDDSYRSCFTDTKPQAPPTVSISSPWPPPHVPTMLSSPPPARRSRSTAPESSQDSDELKLNMFRTLNLFYLFSVTATLLLPTNSHVNFNTSSMLLAQNHSKTLNMACEDRKDCSSVDNDSAYVARRLTTVDKTTIITNSSSK